MTLKLASHRIAGVYISQNLTQMSHQIQLEESFVALRYQKSLVTVELVQQDARKLAFSQV